jgi:hypothetical protein
MLPTGDVDVLISLRVGRYRDWLRHSCDVGHTVSLVTVHIKGNHYCLRIDVFIMVSRNCNRSVLCSADP